MSEYWLIDAGVGRQTELLLTQLREDGVPNEAIGGLLLTHYHLDHSGGARWLHENLGLTVAAGGITAAVLAAGDEEAISLGAAKRAGVYPDDFAFQACPVSRVLADGEEWEIGDATIRAKSGLLGAEQGRPSLGWMVGWAEKGNQQTVFAMNMDVKDPSQIPARMTVTQQCLTDIVAI